MGFPDNRITKMVDIPSILNGERLALSRLLSQIENDSPEGSKALNKLFPHTGKAHLIGITGAPGTGKSSLVNQLAYMYRHPPADQASKRVAVVAVDPSSPFTGGALLGDRVRMKDLIGDPGVFIRSMATRGSLGGLAKTTAGIVQAFDASGYEVILIETVGAGQAEVDIARLAHTTLVIEAPGLGDDIQAIKAGILEIADILVINKADRPGVENTERALQGMLNLAHPVQRLFQHHGQLMETASTETANRDEPVWIPPIFKTVATDGTGVIELREAISQHRYYLNRSGDWDRRERSRLATEIEILLQETLFSRWQEQMPDDVYTKILQEVFSRETSPFAAVEKLLKFSSQ
jgi:LAO/AO transport system kinase